MEKENLQENFTVSSKRIFEFYIGAAIRLHFIFVFVPSVCFGALIKRKNSIDIVFGIWYTILTKLFLEKSGVSYEKTGIE